MVTSHYYQARELATAGAAAELQGTPVGQIVIRPNNSMSWRASIYLLLSLMIVSITVAVGFVLQGYWMILPFSMLELAIVCACIHYVVQRNFTQEVLMFSSETLVVEAGGRTPVFHRCWQRFFTKILVHPPKHPWYSAKVVLQHRDEQRELGRYLTDADKRKLIAELNRMVARANQQH